MFWSRNKDTENVDTTKSGIREWFNDTPQEYQLAFVSFVSGCVAASATIAFHRRYLRRLPNSEWITPDMIAKKRWIKGKVTSVGDNDNFRVYHTPWLGWNWPLKFRRIPSTSKELKDQTIHIRLAGIDAPEGSHFGRPGQKYADESLAWLKSQVEGKTVYCQLVRKDQYSRIVAVPHLKPRFLPSWMARGKCISLEMLRAGWAVTYEQSGAEYGKWGKEEFLRLQAEAQAAKRGMWKYGALEELPSEYKRRYAASAERAESGIAKEDKAVKGSWWRRLLGR
ncbi:unnamed protein product [Somion occarium]|uniref:TNase-like domain-containing protein n=1 Tax=Somion occarium TaxID=3059160 RepID=A0ABP1CP62_9APHY